MYSPCVSVALIPCTIEHKTGSGIVPLCPHFVDPCHHRLTFPTYLTISLWKERSDDDMSLSRFFSGRFPVKLNVSCLASRSAAHKIKLFFNFNLFSDSSIKMPSDKPEPNKLSVPWGAPDLPAVPRAPAGNSSSTHAQMKPPLSVDTVGTHTTHTTHTTHSNMAENRRREGEVCGVSEE